MKHWRSLTDQVYVVNVSWSDGSTSTIYRRYSVFFELHVRTVLLLENLTCC
jgi:hypothetical protein